MAMPRGNAGGSLKVAVPRAKTDNTR